MVKNMSLNAGDKGLIPGQGNKIQHAAWPQSLCAATTDPAYYNQISHPYVTIGKTVALTMWNFVDYTLLATAEKWTNVFFY